MRALLLAALLALPAAAQDSDASGPGTSEPQEVPPEESPRPEPRPDPEDRVEDEPGLAAVDVQDAPEAVADAAPGVWRQLAETEEELARCLARLDALGARYERLEGPVTAEDPDCGIANPVSVSAPAEGVEMSSPVTIRCETAAALGQWTARHLAPAAEALGRGALVRLDHGGGYTCRRRNNAPDGRLSEHSFGNAVDIVAFGFAEGDPIAVEPRAEEGTLAEAYQRAARASSCLYFTTVLGPGTDAAHADHIHADIRQRRGGYRLCQ